MVNEKNLKTALEHYKNKLSVNDYEFFLRVYKNPDVYKERLVQYGFSGADRVLDAGAGFGQWSIALSKLNNTIYSIEYDVARVNVFKKIIHEEGLKNIEISQGSIERMPYQDNFFDTIFCYGVIFLTDWKASLKEFYRVLKKNGKLYINANSYGWYRFIWDKEHNKTIDYDPKHITAKAFYNTWKYYNNLDFERGVDIIIEPDEIEEYLHTLNFKDIVISKEGHYMKNNKEGTISSFFIEEYKCDKTVYEVVCSKS